MMHTFQLYNDVPAIECRDGSLMSESFVPTTNYEEYNNHWRFLDPALWSHQSIEVVDNVSTGHLMNLKRQLSDLANSASGHGNFSSTTQLGYEFSNLGLQGPFSSVPQAFHSLRYLSPSGPMGGNLSSTASTASECASSPDAAKHLAKPFYLHYDTQEMYSSPTHDEGLAFGNWTSQNPYQYSTVHSPSAYDNHTACSMRDLQYTPDPDPEVEDDPFEDNDCIKVESHSAEELALSPEAPSYRDEALGRSVQDDTSSFKDDEEDRCQESESDPEYNPQRPKRRNSHQVKSPGRKTSKRTRSISNAVLGDPKVTKPTQRRNTSTRAPTSRPAKSAGNTQKRIFTCAFSHYGCDATFVSKNEWKRHVGSQHLQLGFYRCDTGLCNPDAQSSSMKSPSSTTKTYNDFNRKDLFTQHHRRMHTPWSSTSKEPSAKVKQDFENSLQDVRVRCWREKRTPPQRSTCGFCRRVFEGPSGWEERMEHVGKHFEGKHNDPTDVENLEEEEDEDLREWAVREGIVKDCGTRGFWLVGMEPVEVNASAGRSGRRKGRGQEEEDIDAEGENE